VSVEEPVCCGGQSEAVLDDVRTVIRYRADVGGLNFGTATAVDDPQTRDCAPIIVGLADLEAEIGIAHLAVEEKLFSSSDFVGFLKRESGKQEFLLTLQANPENVLRCQGFL